MRWFSLAGDESPCDCPRRHPQLLIPPDFSELPRLTTVLPQSHWHRYRAWLASSTPAYPMTMSLPNRCPVRSLICPVLLVLTTVTGCVDGDFLACAKHPQDFVLPVFRFAVLAMVVLPQSHWHSQNDPALVGMSTGLSAVSLPNRWPVRSTRRILRLSTIFLPSLSGIRVHPAPDTGCSVRAQ